MAAKSCRGLPAELAAKLVVKVGSTMHFRSRRQCSRRLLRLMPRARLKKL